MMQAIRSGDAQLLSTAVHEAGHAVVAEALDTPVRFVSIRPAEAHLGIAAVDYEDYPETFGLADIDKPYALVREAVRRPIEVRVLIVCAGHEAERLYGPRVEGFQSAD